MVSRKTNKSKAIKKAQEKKRAKILFFVLFGILITSIISIIFCFIFVTAPDEPIDQTSSIMTDDQSPQEPEKIEEVEKIDFQPVIDEWIKTVSGKKSILIYDLENNDLSAKYNTEAYYNIASLYKLFVVYEGYRKIERKEWSKDASVGKSGYTISECLDLAIRESNSVCAETLLSMIGREKLNKVIKNDFEVDSNVLGLTASIEDINKIMKIFYEHKDIKDETLISKIKDSFLVQPTTKYNWRQGLPSGFNKANVYNKVGWEYNEDEKRWNIYHDAAIVEFPEEDRHFIVIVMTEKIPYQKIRNLGTLIENYFYSK